MDRVSRALEIMNEHKPGSYHYLGNGWEAVVIHDFESVYKIFIPIVGEPGEIDEWKFVYLKSKKGKFKNRQHLIDYEYLSITDEIKAIRYPYRPFEDVNDISEGEAISFLVECWQEKVVFKDVKLKNFVRINGILTYVDYGFNGDFTKYTDNYFQNMAARVFIDLKYPSMIEERKSILKRSTINNFNLPELEGFHHFLNKVFSSIIFEEGGDVIAGYKSTNHSEKTTQGSTNDEVIDHIRDNINESAVVYVNNFDSLNFEAVYFGLLRYGLRLENVTPEDIGLDENGYHKPKRFKMEVKKLVELPYKISLLIKTCPQDSKTLYPQVKHIIKQLSSPNRFHEKIIAIDRKERDFLREYSSEGSLEELYSVVEKLIDKGLIDYCIELPDDEIDCVNYRWFGLKTKETHTITNIPVSPQLYAFEKAKGDYILQTDSDVMIGRDDPEHSFLSDMIKALEDNINATSVGFNIPKEKDITFVDYHAPQGGYKPEVRFSLIHKKRLINSRPWPNELNDGKLKWSWYQSLQKLQKGTDYVSLRGGNPKTYYIHPQNYRKDCKDVWYTILDRIEKGIMPDVQREEFDLAGSYYDWTIPTRNEELVIVTLLRNVSYSRFLRTWNSIVSQKNEDFGWIIIDDSSDNGINFLIEGLIGQSPIKDRITFLSNRFRKGAAANTYKAIHYFLRNPETVVIIVDGDDALLGSNVLDKIRSKYFDFKADVVIGKMYRTDKLWAHYPYKANFHSPRLYGGNVWQHLRTFKKHLFDSINLYDLRTKNKSTNFKRGIVGDSWLEHCVDYAYMVPIVEMSDNPSHIETYNYYHERSTPNNEEIRNIKDEIIDDILSRKSYTKKDVIKKKRKNFKPNLNKIEIDITYDCDLKCVGCNRSCSQAPSKKDYMSLTQIEGFIKESIELGIKWELINILGGEPTLHSEFLEIINLLMEYIANHSPQTVLQITSNGHSEKTLKLLDMIPESKNIVIDMGSFKTSNKIEYFTPFNISPIDYDEFEDKDFSKGCWNTAYCGIGLNKYGYYPCGPSGGIDRVMGCDIGIKNLKDVSKDKLKELLNQLCKYCGNYVDYDINYGNFIPRCEKAPFKKNTLTNSWIKIYQEYHEKNPTLTPIYERDG